MGSDTTDKLERMGSQREKFEEHDSKYNLLRRRAKLRLRHLHSNIWQTAPISHVHDETQQNPLAFPKAMSNIIYYAIIEW